MLNFRLFYLQLTIYKKKHRFKENSLKINITPYNGFFYYHYLSYRDKHWYLEGYIIEKYFTMAKIWNGLSVFWKYRNDRKQSFWYKIYV